MAYAPDCDTNPIFITNGTDISDVQINDSGSLCVKGVEIDEENITRIAKQEAQKVLADKLDEVLEHQRQLNDESLEPIQRLRNRVIDWLK